ncbi:MAG: YcxB family protein [Oscillospiraceae bacterium]|nr:YcxB family protein [Oscillospiraceae bacterium]
MEEPRFVIRTQMEKEDYRKFLYTATFRRSPLLLPVMAALSFAMSLLLCLGREPFSPIRLLALWAIFSAAAVGAVCFQVERKNRRRAATDQTGFFGSVSTLSFYEDRMAMSCEAPRSFGELRYEQFYGVMESREFFIFYLSANQASLVRKKDLDDPAALRAFLLENFPGRYRSLCC